MNERIRELAEQATSYADTLDIADQKVYQEIMCREFAELIIRECVEQVRGQYLPVMEDEEMMKDTLWDGYVQCGVDSVVAIEEHFGVEE